MDLTTRYLGLELAHPFMPGASPLVDDLGSVRNLEDRGASAIVMHSLFEEQILGEELTAERAFDRTAESFAEALSYFPRSDAFRLGPDEYLEQVRKIKAAVRIPVIASLNGATEGGWLRYARLVQDAGADAVELNVYTVATDPLESGDLLERRALNMLRDVKRSVRVPVALKLSPFYSSLAHFAKELDGAGADGLVLFNRFYQPDIDVEGLEVEQRLDLSSSSELLLRLRWLAILSGHVGASLAVSGGVHTALDAIKAIMTGAHAVQVVSALLRYGVDHLGTLKAQTAAWLEEHEYESLRQMQGSMNLVRCPDPKAFERANYAHILQSWRA